MKVHQIFFKNTLRNFSYLIVFDDGTIYCIDPFNSLEVLESLGQNGRIEAIINTHDHCDHYSGNEILQKKYNCRVYAHSEALVPGKTHSLKDGEIIYQKGGWQLESVHTPGHTFSHLCLLVKKDEAPYALFTGDCFFLMQV